MAFSCSWPIVTHNITQLSPLASRRSKGRACSHEAAHDERGCGRRGRLPPRKAAGLARGQHLRHQRQGNAHLLSWGQPGERRGEEAVSLPCMGPTAVRGQMGAVDTMQSGVRSSAGNQNHSVRGQQQMGAACGARCPMGASRHQSGHLRHGLGPITHRLATFHMRTSAAVTTQGYTAVCCAQRSTGALTLTAPFDLLDLLFIDLCHQAGTQR